MRLTIPAFVVAASAVALAAPPTTPPLTLELKDFATLPITGNLDGAGQVDGMLARVNSIREEPGGAGRLFVTDMNGPIYILDKKTRALATYLDFNGSGDRPGLFDRLLSRSGLQQRHQPVPVRSRLPAQRQVLHGAHGKPGSAGIAAARYHETSGPDVRTVWIRADSRSRARRGRSTSNRC